MSTYLDPFVANALPAPSVDAVPGQCITIVLSVTTVPVEDATPFLLDDDMEVARYEALDAAVKVLTSRRHVVAQTVSHRIVPCSVDATDLLESKF